MFESSSIFISEINFSSVQSDNYTSETNREHVSLLVIN